MSDGSIESDIAAVRRFSRFYTRRIGVLNEALLGSAFTLPEGRVVYEISRGDAATSSASALADFLGLDRGYLSRLIKGLEERGFLARSADPKDARRSILTLTPKGESEAATINERSRREVAALVLPLTGPERRRLVSALGAAESLLDRAPGVRPEVTLRDVRPGDIGWVVHRHGVLYSEEYGWDRTFEALVARVGAEFIEKFDPKRERGFMAEVNGAIVGSVFLVKSSDTLAKLRLLFVEPEVRGLGVGRKLVEACLEQARAVGYTRITLWTNDVLTAARKIYVAQGFELVSSEPHQSFGKSLVSETWERDL